MPVEVLQNVKTWLAGYELSGQMNALALRDGVELHDATVFNAAGRVRKAGLADVDAQLEGYWRGGADEIDEILATRIGVADVPMTIAPNAGSEGDRAFAFRALAGQYVPGGRIGQLFAFSVSAQGSAGVRLVRGTLLHNAARTATANGTARNLGAVLAAQKLYAALHVVAVAGVTPTLDVILQSDNAEGFPSATNRITFAQKAAIGAEWAVPVAGAITDDWWRLAWTIGGTGSPSFTFVVVVGIQ